MKNFLQTLVIILVSLVFVTLVGFGLKYVGVNMDRFIFKESISYNESASSFLADCLRQYNTTNEVSGKKAICSYVIQRYPNLDTDKIENNELKSFYKKCMKGVY